MENPVLTSSLSSPYSRFNLYRNPFGELTREERAELAVVDTQQWVSELATPSTALQFVGLKGHGKTTHLLAIRRMLPHAAYVYLPEDGPHPPIPDGRPVLIDEAQRLSRWQRRRVFRSGGPLALGTHEDLTSELKGYALRVVTVWVARELLPEQLMQMLNRRIEASRMSAAPVPRLERPQAMALLFNRGCRIRDIEQDLYEQFQNAVQQGLPWPPAI